MAEIKAKIGLTPKGAYSATATYDYLDYVTTADGTYTSKQASNTGHALTETDWWEHDFIAPKMRINSGVWEVSYDGGTTYTSTGISALGKDGITPQIRINTTSKNWETSVDSGTTWVDTGITAVQTTTTASVVQVTGQSTTDVMSQKAITDAMQDYSIEEGNSFIIKLDDTDTFKINNSDITRKSGIVKISVFQPTQISLGTSTKVSDILSYPDMTKVTDLSYFIGGTYYTPNLTELILPDTPLCTNLYMFARRNRNIQKIVFGICNSVINIDLIVSEATKLTDLDMSKIDFSNVTNTTNPFYLTSNIKNFTFGKSILEIN